MSLDGARSRGVERARNAPADVLDRTAAAAAMRPRTPEDSVRRRAPEMARLLAAARTARRELAASQDRQQHLEARVRQSQKMEAVGQLAGGVAHDFNNILAIILGTCELLRDSFTEDDPRRADAEAIIDAGQRGAALARQLLSVSRPRRATRHTVGVNEIVGRMQGMLGRVIGEGIDLSVDLCRERHAVAGDASQIEQVVMNLVVNARDAMPTGGSIVVSTACVTLDDQHPEAVGAGMSGACVVLSVRDTGCGMDDDTRLRIFEPFFTTKEPGRGTGLGLATCLDIVSQSGGHIAVRSRPGEGSTFTVYLPRVGGTPEVPRAEAVMDPERLAGRETILLLEDDDGVRTAIRRMLTVRGYRVLEAREGDEALAIVDAHVGQVDLVVSDMVIPGASGQDVVTRLQEVSGPIKVLFMSGHAEHVLTQGRRLDPGVHFIQKPVLSATLAARVREVLDGSPATEGACPMLQPRLWDTTRYAGSPS